MTQQKGYRRLKLIFVLCFSSLVSLAFFELGCRAILYFKYGKYESAALLFKQYIGYNQFIERLLAEKGTCNYADTLFPHPYLGFVHHKNPPCGFTNANNRGLSGEDYPDEKRADRFTVLLTGGSVAIQLMSEKKGDASYIESILNERYMSPSGKPFMVLNGGAGAWKQPQQAILFLLYLDLLDGVITLDGFNEHHQFFRTQQFEYPDFNFSIVNPLAKTNFEGVIAQWIVANFYRRIRHNPILVNSHAAFLSMRVFERLLLALFQSNSYQVMTTESLFANPKDWGNQKQATQTLSKYNKYIDAMDTLARANGILTLHFIQPVPAIDKVLTEEEKKVVGGLRYKKVYLEMIQGLLSHRKSRNILNLGGIFKNEKNTIYVDDIHCKFGKQGHSPGYQIMAEAIAKHIAQTWRLKKRDNHLVLSGKTALSLDTPANHRAP